MDTIWLTVEFNLGRYEVMAVVRKHKGGVGLDSSYSVSLCEVGSQMAREFFGEERSYKEFRERAGRLQAVVDANQDYLMGASLKRAVEETSQDRADAQAIRGGAQMDPSTGLILGVDKPARLGN